MKDGDDVLNKNWEDMSDVEKDRVRQEEQEKFSRMQPIGIDHDFIEEDDGKAARAAAIQYWKDKYPNGVSIDTSVGTVLINAKGIKHSLSHGFGRRKLAAIPTLEEGMRNASYIGSLSDFDDKGIKNHFFLYKLDYKEDANYVICRIRDQFEEKRLYIHEVAPIISFAQQKSDSLLSQPANQSYLQLRGIALYRHMITDFLQGVNGEFYPLQKEEKNMPDSKAIPKLPNAEAEESFSDNELSANEMEEYHKWLEEEQQNADMYHQEILNSLTYAEEPLGKEVAQVLREHADDLHTSMKKVEDAEKICGPDQETWDGYVPRHENIVRSIEQAGDAKSAGKSEDECSKALLDAQESMREGTAYMQERCNILLAREKEYQEQLEGLRRRIAELERERELRGQSPEDLARCLAASTEFLAAVEAIRKEAKTQPRIVASDLFAASRDAVKEAYYSIKLAPTKVKGYLTQKLHKAIDGVLHSVAAAFDSGIASLEKRRTGILEKSHEIQSAAEFYRSARKKITENTKEQHTIDTEAHIARDMVKAGFGAYAIEKTLLSDSPYRKEMEEGAAKRIVQDALRAREEAQKEKTR